MKKKYLSKEADGSITEFEAENTPKAIEQYYMNKCSGELFIAIDLEMQPSTFRNKRNERMLIEYDQKQLWMTGN